MRSILLGLILIVAVPLTVLSLRPGGIRRQLRYAARRFRIMLVLGGIYVMASTVLRIAFQQGPIADYAPPVFALVLLGVFLVIGRDPEPSKGR